MDELELLKKRVDELESLVRALLGGDERVVNLKNTPIGNVVLGNGCQVTMQNCPNGLVFFGDQDAMEEAAFRLEELSDQADELSDKIDELEGRLKNVLSRLDGADE